MRSKLPQYIERLNQMHAVVMVKGKCVILNEECNPSRNRKEISFSSPTDFHLRYCNQKISIPGTEKKISVVRGWLAHPQRRQFEGLTFAPGQDASGYYNLWTGFAVEPKPGNCDLYLRHLRDNVSQGNDEIYQYIINWMAQTVQFPSDRPGVSIVMRGKQGTGKGVACTEFGQLWGPHFVPIHHGKHLTGQFNAHIAQAVVVFADEAFWAGDRAAEGALKALITEEEIPIEYKGKDVFYVKNHIRLLMASNHSWVVPAGLEDRRFFVLDVGEKHMQDHNYFAAIEKEMSQGGREALLHHLMNTNLKDVNLRIYPQTNALMENKLLTMTPVEKFWYEKLMAGSLDETEDLWQVLIPRAQLQAHYLSFAKAAGVSRRSTHTELGMGLRKLCPGMQSCYRTFNGKRVGIYEFPNLSMCREAFDQIIKYKHQWPKESMTL